jgi:hypothetical protein
VIVAELMVVQKNPHAAGIHMSVLDLRLLPLRVGFQHHLQAGVSFLDGE